MKLTPEEEIIKIRQEMLAKEVDAELKNDQIRELWQKYRFLLFGLIVAIIATVIGCELYDSWQSKLRTAESDKFETAVLTAYQGQPDVALNNLTELSETGKTAYQYLADLKQAGILIGQGKQTEAFALLKKLMNDTSVPDDLRSVARLSLAGHQMDTANPSDIQALLQPLLSAQNPFYGSAAELMALTYLKQNNPEGAKNIINQALNSEVVPVNMKQRLMEILSVIEA